MMLESVYSGSRLAHLWSAYDFCSHPRSSSPPARNHHRLSYVGSRWAPRLCPAGFGYAHLFQPAYENCVRGLPNTTARAIRMTSPSLAQSRSMQARRAWRKLVAEFLTTPVRLPQLMGSTSLLRATQTTSVDTSASTMTLAAPLSLLIKLS